MAATFRFHPAARAEYKEAARYYLDEAGPGIAADFVNLMETGIASVLDAPETWRVVEAPGVRRYIFRHFPYLLYYRWEQDRELVIIYAVMHSSREPGYWRQRLSSPL